MSRSGLLLAVCLLFGCAPLPRVQASYRTLGQNDVERTAKAIAELRGWKLERMPRVFLDDRESFVAAARMRPGLTRGPQPTSSRFAVLFGVGPSKTNAKADKKDELHVAGFYEGDSGHVHVLAPKPRSDAEGLGQHGVLAHELIHSLQDQKFKLRSGADMSADARLAYRALIEGDASAAQLAYGASLQGLGVPRALRRARYAIAEPQRVSPAASPTADVGWASSPKAAATLRSFPYQDGLAFVVDLYRAGGFALVDEAYGRLPTTTEHVLHPEKYLADEQPRAFAELKPPSGIAVVEATSIGELLTRVVLEPCVGRKHALAAAAGWNGDRAFLLSRGRAPMLGWVSAWDSESDAEDMQEALVALGGCLTDATIADQVASAKSAVRREGAVVAFVRGGDPGDHAPLIESLLALPGEAPSPTPLSKRVIPPLREPPEPNEGLITSKGYKNDFLGLTSTVKATLELELRVPSKTSLGFVNLKGPGVAATMGLSLRLAKPGQLEASFQDFERDRVDELAAKGAGLVRDGGMESFNTPIGRAYHRRWTSAELQRWNIGLTIVPICGGAGAVTVASHYFDHFGAAAVADWVRSWSWLDPKARPPVCEYLDPEGAR